MYLWAARMFVSHCSCLVSMDAYYPLAISKPPTKLRSYKVLLNSSLFFSTCMYSSKTGRVQRVLLGLQDDAYSFLDDVQWCACWRVDLRSLLCVRKRNVHKHTHTQTDTHTHKHTQTQQRFVSSKL